MLIPIVYTFMEAIMITAKIENGNLVITAPLISPPELSKSGKSLLVASSYGNMTIDCKVNGRPITIGLNAYIKPPAELSLIHI